MPRRPPHSIAARTIRRIELRYGFNPSQRVVLDAGIKARDLSGDARAHERRVRIGRYKAQFAQTLRGPSQPSPLLSFIRRRPSVFPCFYSNG